MAEVRLNHITKKYDNEVTAVKDLNMVIEDQTFVVLVGPSGCGKSTILRMIAGLEAITEGEIIIDDKCINHIPPKDRDIAMVFQNYALYPHMTVYNNMAFGLKLRKLPKEEIQDRVHQAAEILGILDLLDRKPKALSGGQRQRVAVGRAIVRKPKVFLFDEPLSNLDAKLRVQMRTEISRLHHQLKTTMIYVTHDQVEAMTMGSKIVVLKEGLVQQASDPITLYHHPANRFVAGFIGSPPMNFFNGVIQRLNGGKMLIFKNEEMCLNVVAAGCKSLEKYIGKEVICGIRPENIYESDRAPQSDTAEVQVRVELVEPMGSEVYLNGVANGSPLIARLHAQFTAGVGTRLPLIFDMTKVHFFNKETEETIF